MGDYREQSEKAVESATGETVEKIVDVSGAAHKTFAVSTTDRQLIVKFCHQEKNEPGLGPRRQPYAPLMRFRRQISSTSMGQDLLCQSPLW